MVSPRDVRVQVLGFIVAAISFTAAFLWRDVIMLWIQPLLVGENVVYFTVAVSVITVLLALFVILLTRLIQK